MNVSWKRLAELDKYCDESDFQRAALRLMNEQVLYQSNPKQRSAYDLVSRYENEYSKALDLFGCRLDHNTSFQYVACVPRYPEMTKMTLDQTLLVLVLRKIYDHHMQTGTLDKGIASVTIHELEMAYSESTQRELQIKPITRLDNLFQTMRRWGLARMVRNEDSVENPWIIQVLPAIQSLVNEQSLAILKAHAAQQFEPEGAKNRPEVES
ncbi:DUF4194 domain-containing protein [Litoribacillus peritrichatus]|uniref:DUF4194 domain-containing protein n=1 Tax=Litoribacillus peritrichatus TaxID=718191 RepID=A0ABP7MLG4_9GAMM